MGFIKNILADLTKLDQVSATLKTNLTGLLNTIPNGAVPKDSNGKIDPSLLPKLNLEEFTKILNADGSTTATLDITKLNQAELIKAIDNRIAQVTATTPLPPVVVTPSTPPVITNTTTITLGFASNAEANAAVVDIAAMKYGKIGAFVYTHDDGGLDFFNLIYPKLQSLTYTDGSNGIVKFRATGAIFGKDSSGVELHNGANPGKYTWSNMLEMVMSGNEFANHSFYHTNEKPIEQVELLHQLAKTRFSALGSAYELGSAVIPDWFMDYIAPFVAKKYYITSQGTAGNLPIIPQYTENKTFQLSELPTTEDYVIRRSNTDDGGTSLATIKTLIDELVTGTVNNPRVFSTFSHSSVPGITNEIFDYVKSKGADKLAVLSLREFRDYLYTKKNTVISKVVSGSTVVLTINQNSLESRIRFKDLTFLVSNATVISLAHQGAGQGGRLSTDGKLFNFYNSDLLVPNLETITPPATTNPGTSTPQPSSLIETSVTPMPYDARRFAWQTGTFGNDIIGNLFKPADGTDGIDPYRASFTSGNEFILTFPKGVFLDRLDMLDGGNSAAGNGTQPLKFFYKTWGGILTQFATFDGSAYNETIQKPLPAANTEIERIVIKVADNKAMWPQRIKPIGRYKSDAFNKPAFQVVGNLLNRIIRACSYWYTLFKNDQYGAPPNVDYFTQLNHFGGTRDYLQVDKIVMTDGTYRFQDVECPDIDATYKIWADNGSDWLACLNGNFAANKATFPANHIATFDAAWSYTADRMNPETYRAWGELVFQWLVRYGNNNHPLSVSKAATTPKNTFPGAIPAEKKVNLGYCKRLQVGNELYKDWKGPDGHMTGRQAAVMWAVCNDGYNSTMGAGIGGKLGDPAVDVFLGLLYDADAGVLNEFLDQLCIIYGADANGNPLVYPKTLDIHIYARHAITGAGIAFELSTLPEQMDAITAVIRKRCSLMKLVVSEYGYSYDQYADRSYVAPLNGRSTDQRIAALNLGFGLWMSYYGVDTSYVYDGRRSNKYQPTGPGVNWDLTCDNIDRITENYAGQLQTFAQGYSLVEVFNKERDPSKAYIFKYAKPNSPDLYAIFATNLNTPVNISLPGKTSVVVKSFQDTGFVPLDQTVSINGAYSGTASEKPYFIQVA